jgi:hypothetical protein
MFFPEVQDFIVAYADRLRARPSQKMVVLMRGLPGCGKSSFVDQLIERARDLGIPSAVCSTNQYFYDRHGTYHFDASVLPANHHRCFEEFQRLLNLDPSERGFAQVIIVDNTNITIDEIDPYMRAVQRRPEVKLHSFRFKCRSDEEAAVQCLRSVHRVSLATVLRRYHQFTYAIYPSQETVVNPKYEDVDAYRLEMRIPNFS